MLHITVNKKTSVKDDAGFEEAIKEEQAKTAEMARKIWNKASPAKNDNPYLAKKKNISDQHHEGTFCRGN